MFSYAIDSGATTVESMAERAHEVPAKYGTSQKLYHPRFRSYGRRIEASLPGSITLLVALAFLAYKRPALPYTALALLIIFCAALNLYSVLKPTIIVFTETHILRARLFGWQAVKLTSIDHTIMVEKLYGRKAHGKDLTSLGAKIRYRSFPSMWAVNKHWKPLLRLDGRVWDAKTMRQVAAELSDKTTVYKNANVMDIDRMHSGLIAFRELHPGWRSATLVTVAIIVLVLLIIGFVLPEDAARAIYLIP